MEKNKMAKTLSELVKPKLTAYELAKEITNIACYDSTLEAHELASQMTYEELTTMHTIGKIVERYPKLWDREY